MTTKVFVSYCHDDVRGDDARLTVLAEAIRVAASGTVELLLDRTHRSAAVGADLEKFIKQIDDADTVIVLLTPGYRDRVQRRGETGVYKEFRRIHDRLMDAEEKSDYGRSFLVLPIVFTATFEDSCPDELTRYVVGEVSWLNVVPDSRPPKVRRTVRPRLTKFAIELVSRINAIATTKKAIFRERHEALFKAFLFKDTRSSWDKPENSRYLDTAFVKTLTFRKVRDQRVSFIVGRKGSGKSTIAHVLPILLNPKPGVVIRLEFEELPLETILNILSQRPAAASDLRRVFSPIYSYQMLWDGFLHLALAWVLRDKLPSKCRLRGFFRSQVEEKLTGHEDETERLALATRALFVFAFEKVLEFIDHVVALATPEDGISGVLARFGPTAFREYLLGRDGWRNLHRVIRHLEESAEGVLITADGFDTIRGYLPLEKEKQAEAVVLDSELLLSLFQVVLNKGPARLGSSGLFEQASFCIAIPYDRFGRARALDRDSYEYRHRLARIAWSGLELAALVRKRLALLRKVRDPKEGSQEQRLENVMRKGFPELPSEVAFQFGSATYRLPLFLYVLRHTFWRPRDVLSYYAALLSAAELAKHKKEVLESEFVRQVIAGATRGIVEDEFLAEFKQTFPNLRRVLALFRGRPQMLSWRQLGEILDPERFETPLMEGLAPTQENKVGLLFDLGVIGVVLDRKTSERLLVHRHAFSFNEGDLLRDHLPPERLPELQYALHPIFCEYLLLDTTGNRELILSFDWEYLHKNEVLRSIAPT